MPHPPKRPDGTDARGILSTNETLKVVPLTRPAETKKKGRPKRLEMPPLPQEIFDGMSELEREHFDYFVQTTLQENPDLLPSDLIFVNQAGLDYINTLRLQVTQLKSGELVTMSRQHPAVQFRAWIDLLSTSRKQRGPAKSAEEQEREAWRKQLQGLSAPVSKEG